MPDRSDEIGFEVDVFKRGGAIEAMLPEIAEYFLYAVFGVLKGVDLCYGEV
jgi:hypothetical protein